MKKAILIILFILISVIVTGCYERNLDYSKSETDPFFQRNGAKLDKNNTFDYIEYKTQVLQSHRYKNLNLNQTGKWFNVSYPIIQENKTSSGFEFINGNSTIQVNFSGIIHVEGCFHLNSTVTSSTQIKVLSRVKRNDKEIRCSQASRTKSFKSDSIDTLQYKSLFIVNPGDNITIQVKTDNDEVFLDGDAGFDDPISATVTIEKVSSRLYE